MRKIAEEIGKNKNLQENLSLYANNMMNIYNDYSSVRLSMNYFTYYEMVMEEQKKSDDLKKIMEEFNTIVVEGIISQKSGNDLEELILKTDKIRKQVINIMKGLTSYVDIFNIYEYCMNRVQYNFEDGSKFLEESDSEVSAQALKYILSDKDNVVMNSKIVELVRQLPLRMTKNKFFEYLSEGIRVYKGSEVSSVEDFLYMLKTTSMVEVSEFIDLLSDDVKFIYNEFKSLKFSEITKEKYDEMRAKLDFVVSYIMGEINIYMSLGELINDVYVLLISSPYKNADSLQGQICKTIIKKVNKLFTEDEADAAYESITDDFIKLEGVQEELFEKISKYDYLIDMSLADNKEILGGLGIEHVYNGLKRIEALESGSIFVEFEGRCEDIADEKYIMKVTQELIMSLKEVFKENEKLVNRAIMAHVLSGLPVFFNNIDEIQNYIFNSLSQCSNDAEKAAVVEILKELQLEM